MIDKTKTQILPTINWNEEEIEGVYQLAGAFSLLVQKKECVFAPCEYYKGESLCWVSEEDMWEKWDRAQLSTRLFMKARGALGRVSLLRTRSANKTELVGQERGSLLLWIDVESIKNIFKKLEKKPEKKPSKD